MTAAQYRCRKCDTIIPRGYRMQYCKCGEVAVDWGAGDHSTIRVIWPDGNPEEWVEVISAQETER